MLFNMFALSSLLVAITSGFLTVLVWLKKGCRGITGIWILFCVVVTLWGIAGYNVAITASRNSAYFWWQVGHINIIFCPVLFFHFISHLTNSYKKKFILFLYLLGFLFLYFNFFKKGLFLGELKFIFGQFYWVIWKRFNYLHLIFYIIFYWIILSYSFILLVLKYIHSSGIQKNQIKYFILGSIIGWIGAEGNFLPNAGLNIYPLSNFFIILYPIVWTYAIIKYRLMDIRVAITRTGIFVLVYTLILGLPFALAFQWKSWLIETFGPNWWISPLILMALLATVGPFIYIYIQRKAEDRLLRDQRRYQNTLKQASMGMTRIRNLRKLLDLIAHIVTKTVKISYAAVYLYNEQTNEYVLQVSRDKGRVPIPKLTSDNPLIAWIMVKREPLIYEEIKRKMEDSQDATYKLLEENMRLLTASVVIPSFLEDRFMGFFVLGDKNSGQIYTVDDLNVFQVLASQAALAIENAQFYEEAKEMQEQIAQAEKMATIGTMADGLSHQINNRLNALSLIAGDTIDTIKFTDTTKCTPEIKSMIENINRALERIQVNVIQGGEVVKGILKYSRKGDAGFEPLDLNTIIDSTLEMVQFKVKLSEIDIIRDFSKDTPKIEGNLVQLQEAFFNFIDNAYDATVERRSLLKEEGYRGRITFSAQPKENNFLEIIIEDNGLGVKEENKEKIFTPFFTTKTSSHKGTGLGLYVVKRIISDTHRGKIDFESGYKIGTRFILELPIAE
jgi:signal transduction histidine kinase